MPNGVKYSTTILSGSLKRGNVALGVNGNLGPTSTTGFYSMPAPQSGKYIINKVSPSGNPNFFAPANDAELIRLAQQEGATGANTGSVADVLVWMTTQDNLEAINFEYEGIVTDGLVLNLDAGFVGSYPTTGNNWYDISGNTNNGTLTNGPTFNSANSGSIAFDGVDDYATANYPSSFLGNPSFSIGGWFKRSGTWNSGATWGIGNAGSNINTYNWSYDNTIGIDLYGNTTFNTFQTYSLTEWKYIIWTYNGSTFTTSNVIIYINGVAYTGNDLTVIRSSGATPNIVGSSLALGRVSAGASQYYGKPVIGSFQMYNRVLSQAEITQNYNAQKARYGL
jgi:hypothetical protein